jgi:single-stranded DNA-binding protein
MPHLNSCSFMGHVGQAPTVKHSNDGTKTWVEWSLAVSTGTIAQPKTMWVKCRNFTKNQTKLVERIQKGDAVFVQGKIDVNAYTRKQDGAATPDVSLLVNEWQWIKPSGKGEADKQYPEGASTVRGDMGTPPEQIGLDALDEIPF